MSEKSDALFETFNTLTELKDHFDHRFKQLLQAKGVRFDDYEIYEVYTNNTGRMFQLKTEYSSCGDTDTDYYHFPLSDLDVDVDELNRREHDRIAKERADAAARESAYRAREAHNAEVRDQAEFKRLKAKYGTGL